MANTLKFNREDVLRSSMELFWTKGFKATSTRDLQQKTSLKPGSIYSTFKNKESLLGETLQHYRNWLGEHLQSSLKKQKNPLDALRHFIYLTILDPQDNPCHLCFVYKTQLELQNTDSAHIPAAIYQEIGGWFLELFEQAKVQHYLPEDAEPALVAKRFQMNLLGWRGFLAASDDKAFVKAEIDQYFLTLPSH